MSAATSRPVREARSVRMAKLLEKYGFNVNVTRVVPLEETIYRAIDPMSLREPDRFVGGVIITAADTCRMRRRAYAARVWLARKLAKKSAHLGFAAAWQGTAREDLYKFRLYRHAYLQARGAR